MVESSLFADYDYKPTWIGVGHYYRIPILPADKTISDFPDFQPMICNVLNSMTNVVNWINGARGQTFTNANFMRYEPD